ncbi:MULTISPECIES: hypothetical protein [unclassified Cryobacterium]|uniref:Rv1678 family membrane protein n=2 Tax=Cryobacterium TaxID=69578 RepID=UPI002AB45128|nr:MULTISPECIES: hypothetical protein [Cryobacterium]MDY7526345.1 hypothetical protein [Cryobacterium sp. 10C2]MDY7557849.1 hypothetical protein [Cryobacterium sp. 10C3]MEB0306584.1 hypothetical protein [Cryobacterium sp. 10I1]MEC5151298.1 hypothetical protein [Cryobacterium psychrotolerans]
MNATTRTGSTASTSAIWRTRGLIVAGFTALSSLFSLLDYTPLQFTSVNLVQALVLVALGALAALGCALRMPALLLTAGAILIVVGLVRLATYAATIGIISGSVNAAALMTGLGTALTAIWITSRPMPKRG